MTNKQKEFEEKFGDFFPQISIRPHRSSEIEKAKLLEKWYRAMPQSIWNWIETKDKQQLEDIINEMIKLSDKIESEVGTPDIKEWKAFKHFRNDMRDKIKEINLTNT